MKQKIILTIAILGLVLGVLSGQAYAVTNKISANFASGSVIVGPNSNTCNAGLAGAVRYMSGSPGILAWCDGVTAAWIPLSGGSTTPGGSNTYVQFNSGGSLGGVAGYVYDLTNNIMGITTSATGALRTGNGTVSSPSHSFSVGGSGLAMSITPSAAAVNLTALGADDWIYLDSVGQRKSGGGSTIGVPTAAGGGSLVYYANDPRTFSWTGGTPTSSGSSTSGWYNNLNNGGGGTTGQGYQITFPASTTPREARIYLSVFSGSIRITASLSDGSSPNVIDTSPGSGVGSQYPSTVIINYKANSAAQTLTVNVALISSSDGYGNSSISAASVKSLTSGTSTGMWQSGANTALDFVVGGVNALQLGTTGSGINYLSVIPGASGNAPIMRVEGRDMINDGTGSQGATLTIAGKDATAAGAGGPLTVTGGAGSGSGAGGDISLTGAASSFWGPGGDVLIAGGNGGSTSGNGGNVTLTAGTVTSGTAGSIHTQIQGSTYMRVSVPGTASSSVLFLTPDAVAFPGGSTAQRPSAGVNGMIRYNTSTSKLETYQAGAWTNVLAGVSSVDDFTDAITNYSATLGGSGNSLYSMFLGSFSGTVATAGSQYNTGAGFSALRRLTSGVENTAFGYPALNNLTSGSYNTAVGSYTLGTDGDSISRVFSNNTAFGNGALYNITTGVRNTIFMGGWAVTTGSDNTSVNGLDSVTTQDQNTSFGIDTMSNGTPSYSTALGQGAGLWDSGSYNVFVGINSHNGPATTNYSTGFGANTLNDSTGNANNTAMGINAGQFLTTGSNNTYFGGNAGFFVGKTTSSGALVLGPGPGSYQVVMTNEFNISDVMFASTGGANYFKIDANQHMNYKGTVPTLGTCGTGPSIVGNDNSFRVTSGSGTPNSCVINFAAAWSTAPICVASTNLSETHYISAVSTTSVTILFGTAGNGRIIYVECRGYF